ncbi:MAG: SLBB domain-containing protein [Sedimentisphaerales bacterium]|nr:SLBB domain-containing protein [Sedimentisphaerales bacterium]
MNHAGPWTVVSGRDCGWIRLIARRRAHAASITLLPARRPRAGHLLLIAILSALVVASCPATAQDSVLGQGPTSATGLTADQIQAVLKAREQQPAVQPPEPVTVTPPPAPSGPSTTELLLAGKMPSEVSTSLHQFGYDVFSMPVSTFAPVTNVPVGPDYVIGPGDTFTVTLWGRVDAQYPLQVDRDGQIVLPEVGVLKVWGMKFGELHGYLQHELSRKFTDFKMSVTMDRLRTIRVFVVGEAATPGGYTISSLSTVINALFAAGGPSKNGSLRAIRLLRNGADPASVDLYKFLLGGDKGTDPRLQDGDTIFIPVIGEVAGVAGNVKRPAIYEMIQPMKLQEVLDLAGGITFAGWLQRVQVERVEDHQKRVVVDFDLSEGTTPTERRDAMDTIVRDGDMVKVFPVIEPAENIVELQGHVMRPGKYELKPGMRLSDVLNYDAFLPQVNLEYGEIERLVPPDKHPVVIPFQPGKVLRGDVSADLELFRLDRVRLFRWDEKGKRSVTISGLVYEPNEYRLIEGMRVSDLIELAGGLQKTAYLREAEITRSHISQDGMVTEEIDIDLGKAMAGDPTQNIPLQDHDRLIVRPIPGLDFSRSATIEGQVRFPGSYPIAKGEMLSSLIERAGGYSEEAYLKGAVFTRESARKIQRERLDKMISEIEQSMLTSAEQGTSGALSADDVKGEEAAMVAKRALLAKLRTAQVTGRVVVKLAAPDEMKGSKYDFELEDNDVLTIPTTPGVVHVIGEVFNATSLQYEKGRTVSYYLRRVGGMTKEADKKQVSVVKADGSVISSEQGNRGKLVFWDSEQKSWFFGGFMSMEMQPGDSIVVPRKIDRLLWLRTTKDLTQIIFQIAVAAGVVFAI